MELFRFQMRNNSAQFSLDRAHESHAQALLRAATKAEGFNIGLNLGECAGAGIVDYLHVHIVPRWSGDTNFMPILTGTRTLSEGLRALYDKLIDAQSKIAVESRRNS